MPKVRSEIWGPVAGIAFSVLFVAAVALQNLPSGDDPAGKIASFYADHGERAKLIVSGYLFVLAGTFFLWFLGSLRARLLAAEGEPGRLTSIAFAGGIVFVALLLAAASALSTVALDLAFGGENLVDPNLARYLPELGYPLLLIGAVFGAIALIDATSVLIRRTGLLPGWIAWYGFAAAAGLLAAPLFFPLILLVLWVLFVSVAMLRADA